MRVRKRGTDVVFEGPASLDESKFTTVEIGGAAYLFYLQESDARSTFIWRNMDTGTQGTIREIMGSHYDSALDNDQPYAFAVTEIEGTDGDTDGFKGSVLLTLLCTSGFREETVGEGDQQSTVRMPQDTVVYLLCVQRDQNSGGLYLPHKACSNGDQSYSMRITNVDGNRVFDSV